MNTLAETQARVIATQDQFHAATAERNAAIVEAHQRGTSVIQIASELGLSRQQIHKLIKENTPEQDRIADEIYGLPYGNCPPEIKEAVDKEIAQPGSYGMG